MVPATRAVFRELLRRELEERYRGSLLGAAWLVLLPLLQLAVLAWVFGHLMPARAHGGELPYAAFLALGLWPWNLLLVFGVGLSPSGLPAAAAALAVVAVYALAAARLLAVLQVFLRDIATVIGQLLVLGFFLTPILYERSLLPAAAAKWLALNPLVAPVETVRGALSGDGADWLALGLSLAVGGALLLLANVFLRRARSHLEDFL